MELLELLLEPVAEIFTELVIVMLCGLLLTKTIELSARPLGLNDQN